MLFRRKIIALFLLLLILGGGYWLWRAQQHPHAVPVSLELAPVRDLGSDPVEVTLHKYYRNRKYRKEDWITTGESITFAFPADMYNLGENQRGGPQWKIRLWLDYHTLAAIEPKIQELEKYIGDIKDYTRRRVYIEKKHTFLQIYSGAASWKPPYHRIREKKYRYEGEYCDLHIYSDHQFPPNRDPDLGPELDTFPYTAGMHFFSLSPARVMELGRDTRNLNHDFYAKCFPRKMDRICSVRTDFRGWDITYLIPKKELCNWQEEAARIRAFLDLHVVKQTGPREPNKEGEK